MNYVNNQLYQHYKGSWYLKIVDALVEATKEPVVVYTDYEENGPVWTRPTSEFFGLVTINAGVDVPRFRLADDSDYQSISGYVIECPSCGRAQQLGCFISHEGAVVAVNDLGVCKWCAHTVKDDADAWVQKVVREGVFKPHVADILRNLKP